MIFVKIYMDLLIINWQSQFLTLIYLIIKISHATGEIRTPNLTHTKHATVGNNVLMTSERTRIDDVYES